MTTLTQPGLSSLIDRLFAEADTAEDARWPAAAGDRADYRQYYGQLKDQPLPVSRATGKLLYMLARSIRASMGFRNTYEGRGGACYLERSQCAGENGCDQQCPRCSIVARKTGRFLCRACSQAIMIRKLTNLVRSSF